MHFTVLIVHEEDESIPELLAPFQENNMGDCPEQYLEFIDETEEIKGRFDQLSEQEKVKYPTLDDYATNYWGANKEGDRYGHTTNPNSEWDWYQIGGRWAGFFLLKPGKEGIKGEHSLLNDNPVYPEGHCDSACISDIDFDTMRKNVEELARKKHQDVIAIAAEHEGIHAWDYYKAKVDNNEITIDEARDAYNNQIAVQVFREKFNSFLDRIEDYTAFSEEEYVKKRVMRVAGSYAILRNGEWLTSNAGFLDHEDEWSELVNETYQDLLLYHPEMWVTIVDCHT